MKASKFIKGSGIAAAAMLLPMSQAVMAEGTWGISGWVNEGISYFDDGDTSDLAQLTDNGTTLASRITLGGTYEPEGTGVKAGFEFIIEPQNSSTPLIFANQADFEDNDLVLDSDLGLLSHNIYVGGDWGKVTVGKQSMPTDNIAVLADPSLTIWSGVSAIFRGNGFNLKGVGAGAVGDGLNSVIIGGGPTWGQFAQCHSVPGLTIGIDCNGIYRNGVRYDVPAFGPVSVAVGWANDDIYDIAAKYAGEMGDFKAQLNVGYSYTSNGGASTGGSVNVLSGTGGDDTDLFQVQGGIMHTPTGLFLVATYAQEETDQVDAVAAGSDDTDAWYFKGGIRTSNWTSIGDSAVYVDYASYNDQYGTTPGLTGSEFERWGIAVEQYIGPRLGIYGKYEEYSLDTSGPMSHEYDSADDLELFTLGLVYFF